MRNLPARKFYPPVAPRAPRPTLPELPVRLLLGYATDGERSDRFPMRRLLLGLFLWLVFGGVAVLLVSAVMRPHVESPQQKAERLEVETLLPPTGR